MALILNRYSRYFIKDATNYEKYEAGYRSYFDPVHRKFLWMKPEDARNAPHAQIPVPTISEYEIYRSFMRTHGFESFLQAHDSLNEVDFCIAVRKAADADIDARRAFDPVFEHFDEELDKVMLQWVADNGIENCKLTPELYSGPLVTKEDVREYLRFTKEQNRYEAEQEEAFKLSRLNGSATDPIAEQVKT